MSQLEPVIEFSGRLSLEGPLLESVFAAYLMSRGYKVVDRIETRGIQHDILVESYDGYVFYECTGQESITEQKVNRFLFDIFRLDEVLRESYGKGLVKAVFVVAVAEDGWMEDARKALEYVKSKVKERINCDVEVLSGMNLLRELISSGVLGIRLHKNRVYFAGPEDYGIRYLPSRREFCLSTAPINLDEFRKKPYSFLPSHYWDRYYQQLYREAMEEKKEEWSNQYDIFSYAFYEGLELKKVEDLVNLYKKYEETLTNQIIIATGDRYLTIHSWSRKHDYYSLHIFSTDSIIDRSSAKAMIGLAPRLIDEAKGSRSMTEPFSLHIYTLTEDWSTAAWNEVHEKMPEPLKADISYVGVIRGNDLLIPLLNKGILGFRFRRKNEITLVGPGVEAVRKSNEVIELKP
jgi:hypothetical protein